MPLVAEIADAKAERIGRESVDKRIRLRAFVEAHSLDEVVANVRRNNSWENEKRLREIEDEVRRTYLAVQSLASSEKPVAAISREYGFPEGTLEGWVKNRFPRILTSHRRHLTPINAQERASFAYLLGLHSSSPSTSGLPQRTFKQRIDDKVTRKRALKRGRVLLKNELEERGNDVRFADTALISTLHHCLFEAFTSYVVTDKERVAYLQGFFDAARIRIKEHSDWRSFYRISRREEKLHDILVRTLFELGIYSRLDKDNVYVGIGGYPNMKRFHELELDMDTHNRTMVASYLLGSSEQHHTIEDYYSARTVVRKRLKKWHTLPWDKLVKQYSLPHEKTVQGWTTDLRSTASRQLRKNVVPTVVQRYEKLLDYLGLPNVFEEEVAVAMGENYYFNVDGLVYRMPLDVQRAYSKLFPEQTLEDALPSLYRQLRENTGGGKHASLIMEIDDQRVILSVDIRYPHRSSLELKTSRGTVVLTNKALFAYFTSYDLPLADITRDDVDFLRKQYELEGSAEGDLVFRKDGDLVTGISLKDTPKGSDRGTGLKDYVGVKLRESERGSFSLIS